MMVNPGGIRAESVSGRLLALDGDLVFYQRNIPVGKVREEAGRYIGGSS
jgi:hypothetical protein